MTSLVLKGVSRELTISTDKTELLDILIKWIENCRRFTIHEGNSYIFPNDNCITACSLRAKKMGLIEIKREK